METTPPRAFLKIHYRYTNPPIRVRTYTTPQVRVGKGKGLVERLSLLHCVNHHQCGLPRTPANHIDGRGLLVITNALKN